MSQTTKTAGDIARKLHQPILNLVAGGGFISRDELKREAASMSGRGGASANALAEVAIHQLEREGKIVLSKSGKSWRIMDSVHTPYERAEQRVNETPELEQYRTVILYDWNEGDAHYEWAATCPLSELIDWAASVESDES